jgi:hypothetical protein
MGGGSRTIAAQWIARSASAPTERISTPEPGAAEPSRFMNSLFLCPTPAAILCKAHAGCGLTKHSTVCGAETLPTVKQSDTSPRSYRCTPKTELGYELPASSGGWGARRRNSSGKALAQHRVPIDVIRESELGENATSSGEHAQRPCGAAIAQVAPALLQPKGHSSCNLSCFLFVHCATCTKVASSARARARLREVVGRFVDSIEAI